MRRYRSRSSEKSVTGYSTTRRSARVRTRMPRGLFFQNNVDVPSEIRSSSTMYRSSKFSILQTNKLLLFFLFTNT